MQRMTGEVDSYSLELQAPNSAPSQTKVVIFLLLFAFERFTFQGTDTSLGEHLFNYGKTDLPPMLMGGGYLNPSP